MVNIIVEMALHISGIFKLGSPKLNLKFLKYPAMLVMITEVHSFLYKLFVCTKHEFMLASVFCFFGLSRILKYKNLS